MTISLELYERYPNADLNPTNGEVSNIGWRNSPGINGEEAGNGYVDYPIARPSGTWGWKQSYVKHNYFKIYGTYPAASRPVIIISVGTTPSEGYVGPSPNAGQGPVRVGYALTESYAGPGTGSYTGDTILLIPGETKRLYPKLSTTGPDSDLAYVQTLAANTTYYTQFLKTQLIVEAPYTGSKIGNIPEVNISLELDEFESGDV